MISKLLFGTHSSSWGLVEKLVPQLLVKLALSGGQAVVCPADGSGENSGQSLTPIGARPLISQDLGSSGARSDIGQEPLTSLSNRGLPLRDANVGSIRSQPGESMYGIWSSGSSRYRRASAKAQAVKSARVKPRGEMLQICLERRECASVRPSLVTVPQIS